MALLPNLYMLFSQNKTKHTHDTWHIYTYKYTHLIDKANYPDLNFNLV